MERTKTFGEREYKIYSEFVKTMPIQDYFHFFLNGGDYKLFLCEVHEGSPAMYSKATDRDGKDIYIWDGLDEGIQRPMIFHELVEIYHRELGIEISPAHNATLPWEKRFCEESLSSSQLERLLHFNKEQGRNGFDPIPDS